MMVMGNGTSWRGIIIPPPDPLAGIGGALRHAFMVDESCRSTAIYRQLVERLQQFR